MPSFWWSCARPPTAATTWATTGMRVAARRITKPICDRRPFPRAAAPSTCCRSVSSGRPVTRIVRRRTVCRSCRNFDKPAAYNRTSVRAAESCAAKSPEGASHLSVTKGPAVSARWLLLGAMDIRQRIRSNVSTLRGKGSRQAPLHRIRVPCAINTTVSHVDFFAIVCLNTCPLLSERAGSQQEV